MNDLFVTLIQSPLSWEKIPENIHTFENKIDSIKESTDLIVLPEMFTTGFTMNSTTVAEKMNGTAVAWMQKMAASKQASIAGSLVIQEEENYYNRLIYANSNGNLQHYDKRHLFRMADEHLSFSPGNEKQIVDEKGWKINLQICYDLRFPVWSRNHYSKKNGEAVAAYDVMIYVANWPAARINAWDSLLKARAIENQCYVIGVNRVGTDGKGISYNGHSCVIDPKGNHLFEVDEDSEQITTVRMSWGELESFRKKFPVGLDAD